MNTSLLSRRRRGQTAASSSSGLEARGISVSFDGVQALDGVDVDLRRGEVMGMIGPNGAGKTTLVNVLTGFQVPDLGSVNIDGRELTRAPAHQYARHGVSRTFQSGRYFKRLSVRENVEAGVVGLGEGWASARKQTQRALDLLGIASQADQGADGLSHGDERRLGIARAVAMRPAYLLLDEPAAGLNERESRDLVRTVAALPGELECGVVVIDHDMRVIMSLCERIQVLDQGRTISLGTPAEVRSDRAVLDAYLGSGGSDAEA